MAEVTVHLYASLREASGCGTVALRAETVASAFDELSRVCPGLESTLRKARSSPDLIVVLVNGRTVRMEDWSAPKRDRDA